MSIFFFFFFCQGCVLLSQKSTPWNCSGKWYDSLKWGCVICDVCPQTYTLHIYLTYTVNTDQSPQTGLSPCDKYLHWVFCSWTGAGRPGIYADRSHSPKLNPPHWTPFTASSLWDVRSGILPLFSLFFKPQNYVCVSVCFVTVIGYRGNM